MLGTKMGIGVAGIVIWGVLAASVVTARDVDVAPAILQIVADYNRLADPAHVIARVPREFPYQAYMPSGGVYVRIALGQGRLFIDLSADKGKARELRVAWERFMRVRVPGVTARELRQLYRDLSTCKYEYYNRLAFRDRKLAWNCGWQQKAVIE